MLAGLSNRLEWNAMKDKFAARVAEAYGRHSEKYASVLEPILAPMADEIVGLAELKGREQVLDLATGTGLIARAVAEFADSVVGIDMAYGVLVMARAVTAGEIQYVTCDARGLAFRNRCFDLVTCGLSLSHFSDISAALAEIRRVLRSQGRFVTSAWGSEGESPSKTAAVEVRNRFLEDRAVAFEGTFGEDVWEDVERGCQALHKAGFADIQVKTRQLTGEYRNHSDAVETALAWPLTRYRISRLDPADQRRLWEETAAAILEVNDLHWQSQIHYYRAIRSED